MFVRVYALTLPSIVNLRRSLECVRVSVFVVYNNRAHLFGMRNNTFYFWHQVYDNINTALRQFACLGSDWPSQNHNSTTHSGESFGVLETARQTVRL